MHLYIIRHGETEWNKEWRLQGQSDVLLNEAGIELAEITSEAMKDIPFEICFTSPLKRAVQTAEIILKDGRAEVVPEPLLTEIGFGELEGKSMHPDHPDAELPTILDMRKDPFGYKPAKGGESIPSVIERAKAFCRKTEETGYADDANILVSSHGCLNRALLYVLLQDTEDFWRGIVPPNCSVSILEMRDGKAVLEAFDKTYYPDSLLRNYYKT
ncbi:MAG: histidine phosphatase family protein [Eubacterium sp.]|nr:histidine phosphatase family protein [Eubacterium sp.]